MDLETYKRLYNNDEAAPGWDAINGQLAKIYPNKEPDGHWGTIIPYSLGGEDPLHGVSAYKSNGIESFYHYISYGFSELFYDEKAFGQEYSKFGFELTFRLKPFKEDEENPIWVVSLMQNLAKYVFSSGKYFDDYHYIPANGPIRLECDTEIQGLVFVTDSQLGEIETVHGKVKFLQMVGITQKEYDLIQEQKLDRFELVEKLKENNPLLITDLERKSIV
jgi:hypothetical protein